MKARKREPDPIAVVMKEKGMTRLQVLESVKAALLGKYTVDELTRINPKAVDALANLDRAIETERQM